MPIDLGSGPLEALSLLSCFTLTDAFWVPFPLLLSARPAAKLLSFVVICCLGISLLEGFTKRRPAFKKLGSLYFLKRNPTSAVFNSKHQCKLKRARCPGNALQTLSGKGWGEMYSQDQRVDASRGLSREVGPGRAAGPQAPRLRQTAAPIPLPATVPGQRVSTGLCRVTDPLAPEVGPVSNSRRSEPRACKPQRPASNAKQFSEAERWCREEPTIPAAFQTPGDFCGFSGTSRIL